MNLYQSPFISIGFHLSQPVSARRNPNQLKELNKLKKLEQLK